jgi:hypothetical protein
MLYVERIILELDFQDLQKLPLRRLALVRLDINSCSVGVHVAKEDSAATLKGSEEENSIEELVVSTQDLDV